MRRISRHISAIEIDLSSFSSNQSDNAFQKRRFTSSIRADDRHGLIKLDPEINTVQCLKIAIERGQPAGFQKRAVKCHPNHPWKPSKAIRKPDRHLAGSCPGLFGDRVESNERSVEDMSDRCFMAHSCLGETCPYHVIAAEWNFLRHQRC